MVDILLDKIHNFLLRNWNVIFSKKCIRSAIALAVAVSKKAKAFLLLFVYVLYLIL